MKEEECEEPIHYQGMDSKTPSKNTNRLRIRSKLHLRKICKKTQFANNKTSRLMRIKRFNGEIVRIVEKQTEVLVKLEEVEVGRIRLDLVMMNVDAILGVKWLRRNRLQFG
jgi:hypothetical protein